MGRHLSYYVRRKLRHRFTQWDFLNPRSFSDLVKRHGIECSVSLLERYEKEGWLQPAFRIVLTKQLQKRGLPLGIDGIKYFVRSKSIEFPKKGDYVPWSSFKSDYKKGELHNKKLFFYHPFQILQILNINRLRKFSFTYYDSYTDGDFRQEMMRIKNSKLSSQRFDAVTDVCINRIGCLMLLEEPYKYWAFGSVTTRILRKNGFSSWANWRSKKFSAKKLANQHGMKIGDVEKLYNYLAQRGHDINPLAKWYDLTRIMRPSVIKSLKGEPLTAQLYYNMASLVGHFYYDLTKKKLTEPDGFFDGMGGRWKKRIYSDPFDYSTRKTQRGIIRFFVKDPTTRIFLLVEGETEERIIGEIFAKLDISMTDDGINVINCGGISNIEKRKLRDIIQISNQDHISVYIIADNEQNSKNKVQEIKKQIHSDFNFHVWNKSFEEDNFGFKKPVDLINSYLKKHSQQLSYREIRVQQKCGNALIKAIANAYGSRYKKGLFDVIQKTKPDISSELMKSRIKKISRGEKKGKPTEIENTLDEMFKMILNWG